MAVPRSERSGSAGFPSSFRGVWSNRGDFGNNTWFPDVSPLWHPIQEETEDASRFENWPGGSGCTYCQGDFRPERGQRREARVFAGTAPQSLRDRSERRWNGLEGRAGSPRDSHARSPGFNRQAGGAGGPAAGQGPAAAGKGRRRPQDRDRPGDQGDGHGSQGTAHRDRLPHQERRRLGSGHHGRPSLLRLHGVLRSTSSSSPAPRARSTPASTRRASARSRSRSWSSRTTPTGRR